MGSPSLQEFVTLYLNEVLSIRAQESPHMRTLKLSNTNLNEVLSIRAQEFHTSSADMSSSPCNLNEVLSIRAQE